MKTTDYMDKCRGRINAYPDGFVFMVGDFLDLMPSDSARQCLHRLEKEGSIRKIIHGVYDKPRMSAILKTMASPDIDAVAKSLAKNFKWNITPGGGAALNILGISTQVPANWLYYSNGPYRQYRLEGNLLRFAHRSEKVTSGYQGLTLLVITALKELGRERCDGQVIEQLRKRLTEEDKARLLKESRGTATWIFEIIKRICA
jgi:hypothetical protein